MTEPMVSVVVPTRDRPDTLHKCLDSLSAQPFHDAEFLVWDNGETPSAKPVFDYHAADARFRYARSPRSLCMRDSWECALTLATGRYVTVLGDDDALLPWALTELDRLSHDLPGKLISWKRCFYCWPDMLIEQDRNYLFVPLCRQLFNVEGREAIRAVSSWRTSWDQLPSDYYSFVPRNVFDTLHGYRHCAYRGRYADVYSGFRNAALCGTFLFSILPFSVAGLSRHSTGVATLYARDGHALDDWKKTHEYDTSQHPLVPGLPLTTVALADAFCHARESYFPGDPALPFDRLRAACAHLAEVPDAPWRADALALIRSTLALPDHDPDPDTIAMHAKEVEAFDRISGGAKPCPPQRMRPDVEGYTGDSLVLDASRFGVTDVFAASQLIASVLGWKPGRVWDYDLHLKGC